MLKDPYCTVDEADQIITSDEWFALSSDEYKEIALKWGRIYLDSKYKCRTLTDGTEIADALDAKKVANALLGEQYVLGNLFKASASNNTSLTSKSVKAGSVSISKKFESSSDDFDPFPQVTDVLAPYCSFTGETGFRNVNVVRA